MSADADPSFATMADELRRCAAFYLLWVASADGPADNAQVDFIARATSDEEETLDLRELLAIVEERELDSLLFAARTLRDRMTRAEHETLFVLALRVAWQKGQLGPGANHVCRFLADLFGIPPTVADHLHRELNGLPLSRPADPGTPHWWFTDSPYAAQYVEERRDALLAESRPLTADEARLVLGVDRAAERRDIRRAYRRMVQIHHPDRVDVAKKGEDARQAAHGRFLRIREAYKVLVS